MMCILKNDFRYLIFDGDDTRDITYCTTLVVINIKDQITENNLYNIY